VIDFQDLDIMDDFFVVPRKADLRAFVLMAEEPLVWKSGLTRFSRNPDSIISNLNRAYDNAIVLRESIGSETLSYIQLALYEINKAGESKAPLIELQHTLDDQMAFWGTADDQIDAEQIRNIIKAGKRIERIDLYARLCMKREALEREVHRMIPRVERSGLEYDPGRLESLKMLVKEPQLNYYRIVREVEAIL